MDANHEYTIILKAGKLMAAHVRRHFPNDGEDVASQWSLSVISRLKKPGMESRAQQFLHAIEPELEEGRCPRCLKCEGLRKARMLRKRVPGFPMHVKALKPLVAKAEEIRLPGETPVERFVGRLSPREAKAVHLKAEGVKCSKIAEQLQMSERSIYHLFKRIRNRALQEGITPPGCWRE